MGLGNLERDLGSNRGYFIKIGGNIFELGLQLGERNFFEFGAPIGVQGRGNIVLFTWKYFSVVEIVEIFFSILLKFGVEILFSRNFFQ